MEEKFFLEENYKEELENYRLILNGINKQGWDWIIITASNLEQKQSYIEQIEYRKRTNMFPKTLRIDVIEDPEGKRVGSGGATLNVLKFLNDNDKAWNNKKILLIHSGGDSKRIPSYSACGKLFSNIPRKIFNNKCSTLFDEFMISFSTLPNRLPSGIMVVSGDVLLLFNSLQVDVADSDVASISIKVPVTIGKNHGVILSDSNNNVIKFLHKLSPSELERLGAVDEKGFVNLDTGCIWLNSSVTKELFNLISNNGTVDKNLYKSYINDTNRLSFYGDLLYPFSLNGTKEEYLILPAEGIFDENLKAVRNNIWDRLSSFNFKIVKTSPSKFIHTGTTVELLNIFNNCKEEFSYLNWENNILTNNKNENISCVNSYIENSKFEENSLIEHSYVKNSTIGKNCLISNTVFEGCLYDNTVIHTLPINYNDKEKYVTRIYSIYDNPKNGDKFLNTNISDFLSINNLSSEDILDKDNTLWEMRLYPISDSLEESVQFALILQNMSKGIATNEDIQKWKEKERVSLRISFNMTNMNKVLNNQEALEYLILTKNIIEKVKNGEPINSIFSYINEVNVTKIFENIKENITTEYQDYKIYLLLSEIKNRYNNIINDATDYEDICYKIISEAIIKNNIIKLKKPEISKDEITNLFPLRLNFGGGWSDTAPYCLDFGGTVLNAAITLNGKMPISVTVKKNYENEFVFISKDGKKEERCKSIKDFKDIDKVGDVFILAKSALILLGIDDSVLKAGGLTIITDVNVPKGSGLGTSSILAAGIFKTLSDYFSLNLSEIDITSLVFCLEQMITTGGGWQDQIGGITNGIKLISTNKGLNQSFTIDKISLENKVVKELNERMVLVYVGQRRIAKNLLRKIMNKYIKNDPKTLDILKQIQKIALLMKFELEKGDIEGFNKLLNEHFKLSKSLDDGVSNMCIEHLISTCEEYSDAFFIAGAGGGGFLITILKDKKYKQDLKTKIMSIYKDIGIEVHDCEFI